MTNEEFRELHGDVLDEWCASEGAFHDKILMILRRLGLPDANGLISAGEEIASLRQQIKILERQAKAMEGRMRHAARAMAVLDCGD